MKDSMYRKVRIKESWYMYDQQNQQFDIFGTELEAMKLPDGKYAVFHPRSISYAWLNSYQVEEIESSERKQSSGTSISDLIGGELKTITVEFK